MTTPPLRSLESVAAANTEISFVDAHQGKLYYRGYDIDDLADHVSFEEVVYLLWVGDLPNVANLEHFQSELAADMLLPTPVYDLLRSAPPDADPMVVLRTAVSVLEMYDFGGSRNSESAYLRKGSRLLAQIATIVSALYRIRTNKRPLIANKDMSFAENLLFMFHGRPPDKLETKAFDVCLSLHADHGLASSTFAARVTISTLAGMHSAITSALAALKGSLHGGANIRVMEMFEEIGGREKVEEYINGKVTFGRRIIGFGYQVYKNEDPRSRHLRKYSEKICQRSGSEHLFEISSCIEKLVCERKGIYPNVDFYSATVQKALGIPKEFFTCIFAVARMAGWVAHIMEQFRDNRLIRPTSNYIGGFGRVFVPLGQRQPATSQINKYDQPVLNL